MRRGGGQEAFHGLFDDGGPDRGALVGIGAGFAGFDARSFLSVTASSAKVSDAPVDQNRLIRRNEWVPNFAGSSPILATHS
jgi:hypothetical protein